MIVHGLKLNNIVAWLGDYLQENRPNIAYIFNMLSQFMKDQREQHMHTVLKVLQYLKTTLCQEFVYLMLAIYILLHTTMSIG